MLPDMSDALSGFGKRIQLAVISKAKVDYDVTETKILTEWFTAIAQPITPQQLRIKPEGQRTWKWWTVWTTKALKLDDEVKDNSDRQYRVMDVTDWSEAGYRKYELTEKPI